MSSDSTDKDLSFGIELEFLLYWRRTPVDEQEKVASMVKRGDLLAELVKAEQDDDAAIYPDPTDCPDDYDIMSDYDHTEAGQEQIRKLFRENGIKLNRQGEVSPLFPDVYLDPTTGWEVKYDTTVVEGRHGPLPDWMIPDHLSCGVEVNSPILRDCEAAHEHVRQVVRLLTDNFEIRVNPNCGYHCHVGAGTKHNPLPAWSYQPEESEESEESEEPEEPEGSYESVPHDFGTLKRAAMLFWAADPTLAALHPPERQYSYWSQMLRADSCLARGVGPRSKPTENEPTGPSTRIPHTAPLQTSNLDAGRERLPILRCYTPAHDTIFRFNLNGNTTMREFDTKAMVNTTVMDGVGKILHRARTRRHLAAMMQSAEHRVRSNYNLDAYEIPVEPKLDFQVRRTVEFREAAASIDADWIVTWERICIGIFSFCRASDEASFRRVLVRLAAAEQAALDGREHDYDAVNLCRDLGLFAEAEFAALRYRVDHGKKLAAWYPGRISFFPGEDFRSNLFKLMDRKANARMGSGELSELKLFWDDKNKTFEGRMVWDMWDALRYCPEYATVRDWLGEALQRELGLGFDADRDIEVPPSPKWVYKGHHGQF